MRLYNCHTHIFTNYHVPDQFLPLGLVHLLRQKAALRMVLQLANPLLNFWTGLNGLPKRNNFLMRLGAMLEVAGLNTQEEVLCELIAQYPVDTRFVALSLDMDYMGAGTATRDFLAQLEELARLKTNPLYQDLLLPFISVDPRRPKILELVEKYHQEHGFAGIKLYPPLGYSVNDPQLEAIYAYAENQQLPIISHCMKGGLAYKGKDPLMTGGNQLAHPREFTAILERYPSLKLCLAHFGGGSEWYAFLQQSRRTPADLESWTSHILEMMQVYPNLYADLSYTISDPELMPLAKVLINTPEIGGRILFGTDYFVVRTEATEREMSIRLRGYLGEIDFWQIAHHNPKRFLLSS